MNNIKENVINQLYRFKILKAIEQTKQHLGATNSFLDTCSYCIARCILQDIISIQQKEKYQNDVVQNFCKKYKDTRDFHSHYGESTKTEQSLSLKELEPVIVELHKIADNNLDCDYIYTEDSTLTDLLVNTFYPLLR